MKTVLYVAFYMVVLVIVGSFIGQGWGMMLSQYMPTSEIRLNPVVKEVLDLYKAVENWLAS